MSSCLFDDTVQQQQESVWVCVCVRYGCRWGSWVVHTTTSSRRAALQNVGVGSYDGSGSSVVVGRHKR